MEEYCEETSTSEVYNTSKDNDILKYVGDHLVMNFVDNEIEELIVEVM